MNAAIYLVALLVAAYGYHLFLTLLAWALDYEPKVRVVVRWQDGRPTDAPR